MIQAMDATTSRDKSALTRRRLSGCGGGARCRRGLFGPVASLDRAPRRRARCVGQLSLRQQGDAAGSRRRPTCGPADRRVEARARRCACRRRRAEHGRSAARVLGAVRHAERDRGRRVAQLPVHGRVAVAGRGRRRVVVAPVRRHRAHLPRCAGPCAAARRAGRDRTRLPLCARAARRRAPAPLQQGERALQCAAGPARERCRRADRVPRRGARCAAGRRSAGAHDQPKRTYRRCPATDAGTAWTPVQGPRQTRR